MEPINDEGMDVWETISGEMPDDNNQTERYVSDKERSEILGSEIDKLSPLYKTIVTLYHNEELSYQEIAKITNLPEGTLKNYLFRARKKLKDNLLSNYKRGDL